jgi:copper chaperone CopZ
LKSINGVDEVNVSLAGGEAKVQFDAHLTPSAQLTAAVEEAGYGVAAAHSQSVPVRHGREGCCG